MNHRKHAIIKKMKMALEALFTILIFLALIIPNSTAFWNPNL